MKKNFKKTLSLILAVLMVMTAVPFSGLATEAEWDCAVDGHKYDGDFFDRVYGKHAYWCSECNLAYGYVDENNANVDNALQECDGGEADCDSKAVCDVCNREYGDTPDHVFDREVKNADYIKTAGNCKTATVYFMSCKCGEKPAEADQATAATFTFLDENAHVWGEYASNGDAECEKDGTKSRTCQVANCGVVDVSVPDVGSALDHDFTEKTENPDYLAAPATCTTPAKYYFRCSECGESAEILENKDEYVYESEAGPVDHHFVEREGGPLSSAEVKTARTCTAQAVCYKVCDMCDKTSYDLGKPEKVYSYGELAPHVYGENTATNTKVLREADCIQDAIYSMCCNVCGAAEVVIPDGQTIADIDGLLIKGLDQETADKKFNAFVKVGSALGHNPDKTAANATEYKAATCTADGHYGKCYCSRCGLEYRIDSEGDLELAPANFEYKIKATGHTYPATPDTPYKHATCTENGDYGKAKCLAKDCGYTADLGSDNKPLTADNAINEAKKLHKLGHKYENGSEVCSRMIVNEKGELERCAEIKDEQRDCTCIACNGQGIMFLLGALLNWIWKLMNKNQYCDCGRQHW